MGLFWIDGTELPDGWLFTWMLIERLGFLGEIFMLTEPFFWLLFMLCWLVVWVPLQIWLDVFAGADFKAFGRVVLGCETFVSLGALIGCCSCQLDKVNQAYLHSHNNFDV